MKTIVRQANQLAERDIIIAPDQSRHVVTGIVIHGLAGAWLTITTDTGLTIDKSEVAAKLDTYDVLVGE